MIVLGFLLRVRRSSLSCSPQHALLFYGKACLLTQSIASSYTKHLPQKKHQEYPSECDDKVSKILNQRYSGRSLSLATKSRKMEVPSNYGVLLISHNIDLE